MRVKASLAARSDLCAGVASENVNLTENAETFDLQHLSDERNGGHKVVIANCAMKPYDADAGSCMGQGELGMLSASLRRRSCLHAVHHHLHH